MDRHDGNDSGIEDREIALLIAMWAVQSAADRLTAASKRLARLISQQATTTPVTVSGVSGMPCAAEFCFREEPLVQPAEPVDSSAMIPPEQILKADRGGE